jgi:hypothetical protein
MTDVLLAMKAKRISGRALAKGINEDHSFLSKVLKGKKPAPNGLLAKAQVFVAAQDEPPEELPCIPAPRNKRKSSQHTILEHALDLLGRGWSIVPQIRVRRALA